MKRSELKRKTGIARKPVNVAEALGDALNPKPKRATTIRKKKPSVAAAQCLQRRQLAARSGCRCEMERASTLAGGWVRCGMRAIDPAHVYTRPKCGAARDLLDAVIHACRPCHDRSKGRLSTETTRIPLRYAQRAWDVILAHSRLGTDAEDRLRIHIGSVGPRPEKGISPYE